MFTRIKKVLEKPDFTLKRIITVKNSWRHSQRSGNEFEMIELALSQLYKFRHTHVLTVNSMRTYKRKKEWQKLSSGKLLVSFSSALHFG